MALRLLAALLLSCCGESFLSGGIEDILGRPLQLKGWTRRNSVKCNRIRGLNTQNPEISLVAEDLSIILTMIVTILSGFKSGAHSDCDNRSMLAPTSLLHAEANLCLIFFMILALTRNHHSSLQFSMGASVSEYDRSSTVMAVSFC